jgi:hypothetical protein
MRAVARCMSVAAAIASIPPAAASAQEAPEHVAQQFLAAVRDTNWFAAASLMHPVALTQFRDLFRPLLQCPGQEATQVRQQLFGLTSAVEAARTSDTLLLASLLRVSTTREEGLATVLRTAHLHVIGHVPEGIDTVHVLARISLSIDTFPVSQIEVMSFQRYGSTWRALLKADFSALGAMLRRICVAGG